MAEDTPVDRTPVVFRPETFDRHAGAVRYVEGLIRTRAPLPGTRRFPGLAMGAWGLLSPGGTISAGSGLSLGSGTVTLCTRDGSTLTDTGESVTVYNSGAAISSGGSSLAVAMEWTEAGWSACECVVANCMLCFDVQTCAGVAVSGATVTVKQGSTTIGTCTTDSAGTCCVDVSATGSGDYDISATKAGQVGSSKTVSVTCPGTTTVSLTVDAAPSACSTLVIGCNALGLPGATLTIGGGSYTSDASGHFHYSLPIGTFPWTITAPGFDALTGTLLRTACNFCIGTKNLIASSGYACPGCACPQSISLSATGTFTCGLGSCSISYSAGTFQGVVAGHPVTLSPCHITVSCPGVSGISAQDPPDSCPPNLAAHGTFSGVTGVCAALNGPWTLTLS